MPDPETTTIRIRADDRLRFEEYRTKTRRNVQGAFSVLVDLGLDTLDDAVSGESVAKTVARSPSDA